MDFSSLTSEQVAKIQALQLKIAETQKQLSTTFEVTKSSCGNVVVTVSGLKQITDLKISENSNTDIIKNTINIAFKSIDLKIQNQNANMLQGMIPKGLAA